MVRVAAAAAGLAFALAARADPAAVGPEWAADWSAKRLDRTMAYYATDAVFVQPDGSRIVGAPAIRALCETVLAANNPQIQMRPVDRGEAGASGFETGTYSETISPGGGGAATHYTGRYLLLLTKGSDGKRLIAEQLWTVDPPGGR